MVIKGNKVAVWELLFYVCTPLFFFLSKTVIFPRPRLRPEITDQQISGVGKVARNQSLSRQGHLQKTGGIATLGWLMRRIVSSCHTV